MVKNCLISLHRSGEHLVCGLFKRHIGTLLAKNVLKQKTCLIPRKRVICDYLLLKKMENFMFNDNENNWHGQKTAYKTLN